MSEITETVQEAAQAGRDSRLNGAVAICVALTAVMMGLCNIKDGNVVQAMSQAQAHGVDAWNYYQAKSLKVHLAENMAEQVQIQLEAAPALGEGPRAKLETRLAKCRVQVVQYAAEKDSIARVARGFATEYDRLNVHDDQFDAADATFSIAVALYGITALTRRRWLLALAVLATLFGAVSGLSGFLGWSFHPSWLAGMLG